MEKLLTVHDLVNATGWSQPTIYKKSARGEIPGRTKLGASLRFKESAVAKWLGGAKEKANAEQKVAR